ncbi:sialidase family protein [Quatrionicoccus australiensis]|uniref:sialidase family protein n=1 Tax=Quatrionicoccus australiensis TaxID=138118 RepID=UPI001CF93419|nr:sialidase family protein [Quatrionicoccus australiensis]MCB4358666.1 exo-alpha-sialidase [Quatrionicoccus australiensis]
MKNLFISFFFWVGIVDASPPGVVVAHSLASSHIYLGSPSIIISPCGRPMITYDSFGSGSKENTTYIKDSADGGKTWNDLAVVKDQYWSSVFIHDEALYIIGTSRVGGKISIRRSSDCGRTWTVPIDPSSGLSSIKGRFFSAPVPVIRYKNRYWRSFENHDPAGFQSLVLSIPTDGDLLNTDRWTVTNFLKGNSNWLSGKFKGWLEGSLIVSPDGRIKNVMRVYYNDLPEKVAFVDVDDSNMSISFSEGDGFVDFPGGGKKFSLKFDQASRRYIAFTNIVLPEYIGMNYERVRNVLAMISSSDLKKWSIAKIVLAHSDVSNHGFQYADWIIVGDDIYLAIRTAYDDDSGGADNQHNSNFITFHRFSNYKKFLN